MITVLLSSWGLLTDHGRKGRVRRDGQRLLAVGEP